MRTPALALSEFLPALPEDRTTTAIGGVRLCNLTPGCMGRMRLEESPLRPFMAQWFCSKCNCRRAASDVEIAGLPG